MSMRRIKNIHSYLPDPDKSPCTVVLDDDSKMQLECSPNQFMAAFKKYNQGAMIQDAFPFLSAEEREFLMTGIRPDEWKRIFGSGR
jgi:hypothetical protein